MATPMKKQKLPDCTAEKAVMAQLINENKRLWNKIKTLEEQIDKLNKQHMQMIETQKDILAKVTGGTTITSTPSMSSDFHAENLNKFRENDVENIAEKTPKKTAGEIIIKRSYRLRSFYNLRSPSFEGSAIIPPEPDGIGTSKSAVQPEAAPPPPPPPPPSLVAARVAAPAATPRKRKVPLREQQQQLEQQLPQPIPTPKKKVPLREQQQQLEQQLPQPTPTPKKKVPLREQQQQLEQRQPQPTPKKQKDTDADGNFLEIIVQKPKPRKSRNRMSIDKKT